MESLKVKILRRSTPEPNTGCCLWLGKIANNGYGRVYRACCEFQAHRISYQAFNGSLKSTEVVRHKCDTRSCVNPEHLVSGTAKDNMRDMFLRARRPGTTSFDLEKSCMKGHSRDLYAVRYGKRIYCAECERQKGLRYYYKKREVTNA